MTLPDGVSHIQRAARSTKRTPGGPWVYSFTTERVHGDFAIDQDEAALTRRRTEVADLPWAWVRQVHGREVVRVDGDRLEGHGTVDADALVADQPGIVLAAHTADCAPVTFSSQSGVFAVAHAGWRGLRAGVIERTVETMGVDPATIKARLGPCIHVECYEFGADDLDDMATRFGADVRGFTTRGTPALDLPAAVRAECRRLGFAFVDVDACTSCNAERFFSHRARAETQRMATLVWREA